MDLHDAGIDVRFSGTAMYRMSRIVELATNETHLMKTLRISGAKTQVCFATGCQGEDSSFITKLVKKNVGDLNIENGDRVFISSTLIPDENPKLFKKKRDAFRFILQELHTQGAKIFVHDGQAQVLDAREFVREEHLHVSGHECRDGQAEILRLLKPQWVIPYHTPESYLPEFRKMVTELNGSDPDHEVHILEPSNGETLRI